MARLMLQRFVSGLAWPGLLGLALATVMAQMGGLGWLPELATHFRGQYLAVGLLLLALFGGLRRPWPAALAVLLVALNGWYLAPYLPLPVPSVAAGQDDGPELIALNLYIHNRDYGRVRSYLDARDAEVLVLSELTPAWVRELQPVLSRYPFWASEGRRSPWGLGVFSRHPLREARVLNLGVTGSVNIHAILESPAGDVELMAVHLASPGSAAHAAQRNQQLARLAELLGGPRPAGGMPRLLVGDMNLTPFSPHFRSLLAQTGLRDMRQPAGFLGTWPTWLPPLQIPIDHCLADPVLGAVRVRRGPAVGSDHYPLEIGWQAG